MARYEISVVLPTRDRPRRLARQLAALRAQTLGRDRFEVIVVDDASAQPTRERLERERASAPDWLRVVRNDRPAGPGAARNSGWPLARAQLVAFTDDDCEATPAWLEALLACARRHPGDFVQGPVAMLPSERARFTPFSHTIEVHGCGPGWETANIAYPRDLLERLGGFDRQLFRQGDTDLGWRAIELGAAARWAPDALVHHAVTYVGPLGRLKLAARYHQAPLVFKRHPQLRRRVPLRVFWYGVHLELFAAVLSRALPRRLAAARWFLAGPYVYRLTRGRSLGASAPYVALCHVVEVSALVRGSVRYRTLLL